MTRFLHPQAAGAVIANRAFPRLLALGRWKSRAAQPEPPRSRDVERSLENCHPLVDGVAVFAVGLGRQTRLVVAAEVGRQFQRIWEEDLTGELNPLMADMKAAIQRTVSQHFRTEVHDIALLPPHTLALHADRDAAREECRQAYLAGSLPRLR